MKRIRRLMPLLGILLIIPLAIPALGLGAALAPVQVNLSALAPLPVATQGGGPQRIQFPPGGTSEAVQGSVAPGATNQYVLQASAGQTLTVQVTTTQGQVIVTITGADGTLLVTDYVGNSTFSGVVPTTQDYTISVQASGQTTAQYVLGITIPATTTPPPAGALRIQFASGATSATVEGTLPANGSQHYVVHVAAGQLMQVEVSPQQNVQMSVRGVDGTILANRAGIPFFRGDVPTTQDYVISLFGGSSATAYTVTVTIPVRISFAAGATSATVQGNLAPNTIGNYVIKAQAGQTMTIQTTTTQGQIVVIVYGADGTVLQSDHAGATGFSGTLPTSQDYLIDIRSVGQVAAVFGMTVTIPPLGGSTTPPAGAQRIQFAAGATSANVQGDLAANGTQQYVIHVAAGQFLQVDVTSQQTVQMSIEGVNGTVVKGSGGIASFRGNVPTTQDYIITLTGTSATSYSMNVIVPVRISFAAGGTSATVQGSLPASSIAHYVISGQAGQTMTIQTTTTQGQVIVIVYGVDGNVLQSDHVQSGSFTGTLPSTQNYLIDVESGPNSAATYSMTVIIPASGSTTPVSGAQRIQFAAGATSATVQGNLAANSSQQYVIRVVAGQILSVDVESGQQVQMSVRGANGTVLQASSNTGFFRSTVPTTQDYVVTLTGGAQTAQYSLTVTVPERISFAPGATSATVQGSLPPNTIGHYVLSASAGQTLTIKTTASQGQVVLVVYGADGTVLISDHAGATSFTGKLPSTQDYFIELVSVGQVAANYSMTVTIPPNS